MIEALILAIATLISIIFMIIGIIFAFCSLIISKWSDDDER